jgi:ABC-type Mn2+/Zn2+ transport system permease subunit
MILEPTLAELLELFGFAVLAALLSGAVCPIVGCFLLGRRSGFHGIALPQFAAAGIAFGFFALPVVARVFPGIDEELVLSGSHAALNYHLAWAAVFTFGGLALLVLVSRRRDLETGWIAAAFAGASAVAILFAHASPAGEFFVHELLRGEILAIGLHEFDTLAVVLVGSLVLIAVFARRLLLVSYDPDTARILGISVVRHELLLHGIVGAVVATGVMTVGPVVLFGLLVLPPLAAHAHARSVLSWWLASSGAGLASAVFGVALSFGLDWPLGPSVVLAASGVLVVLRLAAVAVRRSHAPDRRAGV